MRSRFRDGSVFFEGRRDTPTPTHSTFSPDHGEISAFAIISPSGEWALGTKGKLKMYKIVWLNTDEEPVIGYRTTNKENAQKLVDAWSINFCEKLEVVKA